MAAPSVVQAGQNSATGASTCTVTLGSNTTSGNLLAVLVQASDGGAATAVTVSGVTLGGSAGNFSAAFSQTLVSDEWYNAVWLDEGCAGGQTSVVVTLANSSIHTCLNVIVLEVSGWVSGYPVDILVADNGAGNATATSWSITASDNAPSALWVGLLTSARGATYTVTGPSSPWSANGLATTASNVTGFFTRAQAWTQGVTSAGSVTFSGSDSAAANWSLVLLAIPGAAPVGAQSVVISDATAGQPGLTGVWGCPPGVTTVKAEGVGGGGYNQAPAVLNNDSGGGGGGEYAAEPSLSPTAGTLYPFTTGTAGIGSSATDAGNTTFTVGATTVTAHGGGHGTQAATGAGGAGGTGSTNTAHHNGGAGASGVAATSGGGGGGSGGSASAGNAGSGTTGGAAVTGGGPGGTGGGVGGSGSAPASGPGGGAGGSEFNNVSGNVAVSGWSGQLTLTYTVAGAAAPYGALRTPVQARQPAPQHGRTYRNPGAPLRNPVAGPPITPPKSPVQARIPLPPRGRVASNPGVPPPPAFTSGPPFPPWHHPAQARQPLPPRGRTAGNLGAPVQNPVSGVPFPPWRAPIRSRIPMRSPGGRVTSNPGAPVRNPSQGVPFPPWHTPAHAPYPQRPRGGWTGSNLGAPVRNPQVAVPFPPWHGPIHAPYPPPQPRAGRVGSSPGAPVQNPVAGPPVKPWPGPVQGRRPLPPRGHIHRNAGAPLANPVSGPPFPPWRGPKQARQPLPPAGRSRSNPGAPLGPPLTQVTAVWVAASTAPIVSVTT